MIFVTSPLSPQKRKGKRLMNNNDQDTNIVPLLITKISIFAKNKFEDGRRRFFGSI
jgi:hypothetical protein